MKLLVLASESLHLRRSSMLHANTLFNYFPIHLFYSLMAHIQLQLFIAITALEETAKVHMGIFRNSSDPLPRRKDPLYRHHKKHLLALGPTVEMGSRLQKAVGESRMRELVALSHAGDFVDLRESALYIEQSENGLKVPRNAVSFSTARELLLLAVEAFDDALVGMSGQTYVLSEKTDEIFDRWSSV
jgi:AbiV family abortive infection protein